MRHAHLVRNRRKKAFMPAVATLLAAVTACEATPVDELEFEEERGPLAEVTSLFGSLESPHFHVLPEWKSQGFGPNEPGAWVDPDTRAGVRKDNARRLRKQIEAIRSGDLNAVVPPTWGSADLWQRWQEQLEHAPAMPDAAWREEAAAIFEDDYPSLANSARQYHRHCGNCHGADGGGNGPTAPFLDPRPRNYQLGKYKFTTIDRRAPPTRADFLRVIRGGIIGTAMPAFDGFVESELNGIVDYVQYLSMRGETARILEDEVIPGEQLPPDLVEADYRLVMERWRSDRSEFEIHVGPIPPWSPERVERGRALFQSERGANCIRCHGATGHGDGPSAFTVDPQSGERILARDEWGNPIHPRDFTRGIFRFGGRPEDNYRRIHSGINGTPMPAHVGMQILDPTTGEARALGEDDLWDLVFFVRSLREP